MNCTLRPVGQADLPLLFAWEQQPELNQLMGQRFITWSDWCDDLANDRTRAFLIEVNGRPIGTIELGQFNWSSGEAELRILIADPADRGQGYGKAALTQLLDLAFFEWALSEVYLRVFASNEVALGLYKKLGFRAVGRLAPSLRRGDPAPLLLMVLPKARYCSQQLSLAT